MKGIAIAHSKIRIFFKLPEEKRSKRKLVFSNPGYLLVSKQLAFVLTEDVVSNERLRFSLNMHKYDISKMLKDLCAEGFLVSDGIGRGSTYQLHKEETLLTTVLMWKASALMWKARMLMWKAQVLMWRPRTVKRD